MSSRVDVRRGQNNRRDIKKGIWHASASAEAKEKKSLAEQDHTLNKDLRSFDSVHNSVHPNRPNTNRNRYDVNAPEDLQREKSVLNDKQKRKIPSANTDEALVFLKASEAARDSFDETAVRISSKNTVEKAVSGTDREKRKGSDAKLHVENSIDIDNIDLDDLSAENDDGKWIAYHSLGERIESIDWTNRFVRLKALFAIVLVVSILFMTLQCLILKVSYENINNRIADLQSEIATYESTMNRLKEIADGKQPLADSSVSSSENDTRYVYLTFDDGPSTRTDDILDILASYNVKATFFVCGKNGYTEEYKRIVKDGHTIGMHSYSHDYDDIYESLDSFQTDLHKIQNFIFDTTGVWTTYYRFPGGSSNTKSKVDMQDLIDYLGRENITYFDWNIYGGEGVSADNIVSNVTANIDDYSNCMILLHDASDKEETVEALPKIIEYVQSLPNTELVPITDDTVPVQHK